uniref:Putative secreted peptide n=1 Tax=Anopheles braziliensis TaxID=58242 RepID=A0A2M3ZSH0_9DIPT
MLALVSSSRIWRTISVSSCLLYSARSSAWPPGRRCLCRSDTSSTSPHSTPRKPAVSRVSAYGCFSISKATR